MTKIAILGAAGRMGTALIRCSDKFPSLKICAAVEQAKHPALGQDAGQQAGRGALGVRLTDDMAKAIAPADVLIDFSFHEAVPAHLRLAVRQKKSVVLGTTGLSSAERRAVLSAARKTAVVWAPNMAPGMNILFLLVEKAARALGLDYDIEIVETHHRHKKDAPSGTALKLAEQAASARSQKLDKVMCCGRKGLVGERPAGEIGIHAVRGGDIVGDHQVSFSREGEQLLLSHRATSRDALAMGALQAAKWLARRKPGLYDMNDVLGL